MAPVDLCIDHFTLKPSPDDKGSADLGMQIVKCWSKRSHWLQPIQMSAAASAETETIAVPHTARSTMEILPKIDVAPGETTDHQNAAIRKRLVHMLAVALDLKIDLGVITDLAWQRETLLEILIRIFCDKLTEALRKGMPRRYITCEDDLPTLRGQLDITRQFTRHAVNPSRLACRFDLLSEDTPLNRVMKAAVQRLARLSRRPANQQRLRELAFVYADITDVPVSALRWDQVVIDRTNRSWQELFAMARLFLQDRYQTTTGGAGQPTKKVT